MAATLCAVVALSATGLVLAPAANADDRSIDTGFADPGFLKDPTTRAYLMDKAVAANATYARIPISWDAVAPTKPLNPGNPNDPAYKFTKLDLIDRAAAERGLQILFTLHDAPEWATGQHIDAPFPGTPETYRPVPLALGKFATALATRYSGTFAPPPSIGNPNPTALPRISMIEPWNEPNTTGFLSPQWVDGHPYGPEQYRNLLNAVYDAYHAVQPDATVIAGGTAPEGDTTPSRRIAPLKFLRQLLCLSGRKHLKAKPCPDPARFDVLSHHPIGPERNPYRPAPGVDNVAVSQMHEVTQTLRAAERQHTVYPDNLRRPVWATEFWWESSPPTDIFPAPNLRRQARYTDEALQLMWRQRIPVALLFQVRDSPVLEGPPRVGWATGMLFADDTKKPSFDAVRFPFVARRISRSEVAVWARSPADGTIRIVSSKHGSSDAFASIGASAGEVVHEHVQLRGSTHLSAHLAGQRSLRLRIPRVPSKGPR